MRSAPVGGSAVGSVTSTTGFGSSAGGGVVVRRSRHHRPAKPTVEAARVPVINQPGVHVGPATAASDDHAVATAPADQNRCDQRFDHTLPSPHLVTNTAPAAVAAVPLATMRGLCAAASTRWAHSP